MPITVICTYTLKPGARDELLALLRGHWSTLDAAGLVAGEPSRLLAGYDKDAENVLCEIFSWKSEEASRSAHQLPEVLAVWEPMGQLCESMSFRHFTAL